MQSLKTKMTCDNDKKLLLHNPKERTSGPESEKSNICPQKESIMGAYGNAHMGVWLKLLR